MAASSFTEVAFTVHPQNTANMSRPCVIYQQIMFKQPSQITHISFRNYYCASLIVKQLQVSADKKGYWRTVLRKQLMVDPNFEDDAQDQHVLQPQEFNDKYECNHVSALRFYLFQPSPNWRSFGLRDVMCYRFTATEAKPQSALTTISGRASSSALSSSFSMDAAISKNIDSVVELLRHSQFPGSS